eukprot:gene12070-12211_t
MGVKRVDTRLQAQLQRTRAYINKWPRGGQMSCKKTASLCAAASTNDEFEKAATLWLALSPPAYFSTNSTDTGGVSVIAPAQDQQSCNTCTALAVVAAAQAAVATTLQLDASKVLMSAQDLFFCSTTIQLTCSSGWGLETGAVAQLLRRQSLLAQDCLKYNPKADSDNCIAPRICNRTNDFASRGVFGAVTVAYGCCGVLAEAYAITWTPSDPARLPTLKPRISAANNCYYYTARKGDYLSKVAQQGCVSLQQFLQDNAAQLDDLSKPVVGKRLLVCPDPQRCAAPVATTRRLQVRQEM